MRVRSRCVRSAVPGRQEKRQTMRITSRRDGKRAGGSVTGRKATVQGSGLPRCARRRAVTLQIIWRRSLHAIWRTDRPRGAALVNFPQADSGAFGGGKGIYQQWMALAEHYVCIYAAALPLKTDLFSEYPSIAKLLVAQRHQVRRCSHGSTRRTYLSVYAVCR